MTKIYLVQVIDGEELDTFKNKIFIDKASAEEYLVITMRTVFNMDEADGVFDDKTIANVLKFGRYVDTGHLAIELKEILL